LLQWKVEINFTESVQISRKSTILCALPAGVKVILGWSNGTSKTMQKRHGAFSFQWGLPPFSYLYDSGEFAILVH